eukprot:gene5675-biopygen13469
MLYLCYVLRAVGEAGVPEDDVRPVGVREGGGGAAADAEGGADAAGLCDSSVVVMMSCAGISHAWRWRGCSPRARRRRGGSAAPRRRSAP